MSDKNIQDEQNDNFMEMDEKKLTKDQLLKKKTFEYIIGHQKFLQNDCEIEELEVKDSKLKNAGKGLFTNIDIPKDNVICFYPVKLIQDLEFPDVFYKDGEPTPFTPDKTEENVQLIYNSDYNMNIEKFRIITDNYIPKNQIYVAHIPNDRAYHPDKTYKPQLNNCRFEGLNLVSTREIKAGEELTTTYGKQYWYSDFETETGELRKSRHHVIKNKD